MSIDPMSCRYLLHHDFPLSRRHYDPTHLQYFMQLSHSPGVLGSSTCVQDPDPPSTQTKVVPLHEHAHSLEIPLQKYWLTYFQSHFTSAADATLSTTAMTQTAVCKLTFILSLMLRRGLVVQQQIMLALQLTLQPSLSDNEKRPPLTILSA
ncbi:hypothetical protein HRR90_001675 [Exophiala dermatitidis]|uniref:Uncharacterized protein n=2 Tax=Exophiala dermatitidis TaxID=5970 RepID=H6BPB7_EXODN|nr:uncharacterized protein HMPREF1120_01761 [Exophiala dermatitidis NIH/UT8656]KAJ4575225.1 hypothetical protein HRR79_002153 [Exophiala dermatitidis]EHY53572.1 hypothetical protein HMPREF1120_01761 [Exophiala dermatitidis NIH/UT8656]KAJ4587707.1 hypothetical protein HRR82_001508 [Exophiala dermatitidis]KAJ4610018.1 hypothetical protein HRR85_006286 [Exophiala dermatitidis]KAJ4628499.1 hypothetical protein HRR86_003393 [Exophiala dermatitidis]